MRFERLRSAASEHFIPAMDIYWSCFPLPMQREYYAQECIMGEEDYRFELIMEDDAIAGLCLCWETAEFIYLEHLCVAHAFRGRGIGEAVLEKLKSEGKTLITDADATKGQAEYFVRRGFEVNDYTHIHPSYHSMFPGRGLALLSWPYAIEEYEYEGFYEYLRDTVMAE